MPRFFVPAGQVGAGEVRITGADALHIARSLRMAVGEQVTVCDGEGREYTCRLTHIRDEQVLAEILACRDAGDAPRAVHLYQALPKGDKLEFIVQKAVELGVTELTPFVSERCIRRPLPEKAERQSARLRRIAEEAAKQCGRATLPRVNETISFETLLQHPPACPVLFCYEGEGTRSLKTCLRELAPLPEVAFIVGSEGGFSPREAELAVRAGFFPCHLGRRILRCETAPLFVLSALCYEFELA
ncbi:MAG: 16S rRNA (uracil(1498)-N(3))-methyltransferase [Eubacteriales bacterium]